MIISERSTTTRLPELTLAPPRLLERFELTQRLVRSLTHGEAIVAGIGNSNFDLYAAGHRPQNFYMLGSMGMAVSLGLGVAIAQPRREVIVLEGDGSLLMNLGSLATVAAAAPPNLTIVVWDNAMYQMTGAQATATAQATDLVGVARAAGITRGAWARDERHFDALLADAIAHAGPSFIAAHVTGASSRGYPEFDPVLLKHRFSEGLRAPIDGEDRALDGTLTPLPADWD